MPERVCNNCRWFVEETETIGDYQHEEAVRLGKGFCLIQDFFTNVEPADPACEQYVNGYGVHLAPVEEVKFRFESSAMQDGFISVTMGSWKNYSAQ